MEARLVASSDAMWTSVGYTAWDAGTFQKAEREVAVGNHDFLLGVSDFFPSPIDAVIGLRKQAIKSLGGTLSNAGVARKKDLKRVSGTSKMQDALMCPNYKIFQLQTKMSVPEAVSKGLLLVLDGGAYRMKEPQDPFSLDHALFHNAFWKVTAQLLGEVCQMLTDCALLSFD